MPVEAKICGLTRPDAIAAARDGGAAYVGFIFYPRSPRHVDPARAAALAAERGPAKAVAVTVDMADDELAALLAAVPVDLLQLHGGETPERVAEVRARFGLPVMKSVAVAGEADVARAHAYVEVADRLLFDAKPPKDRPDALPGGNALSFDWQLLAEQSWPVPWMLSGGLSRDNVAEAVGTARAAAVDVSSGVEAAPGVKDPARVSAFLEACRGLDAPG
jgi:phosphoribosylanthranilate isomerase